MVDRTCASCGARVGVLVDRCPACGRDPDLQLIELGVGSGRRRGAGRGPGSSPPDRRTRIGWRQWAPIVVAVVALWGFLAFTAGGGDADDEDEIERAEPERSTTSAKRQERTPSTRRGPRVTTTTTSVLAGAPLLGRETGLSLVLMGDRSRIVELDTGVARALRHDVTVWAAAGGRLLVTDRSGLAWWPAPFDGTGAEPLGVTRIDQAWVDPTGGLVWYLTSGPSGAQRIFVLDADGEPPVEHPLPSGVWPAGVVDGGLVLNAPGGTFVLDADGDVEQISTGSAVGATVDRVYVQRCDESLDCGIETVTVDGDVLERRPADASTAYPMGPYGYAAAIAPDGRLAQVVELDGSPALAIDGETVDDLPLGTIGFGAAAWAPGSEWLFVTSGSGAVYVVDATGPPTVAAELEFVRGGSVWQLLVVEG